MIDNFVTETRFVSRLLQGVGNYLGSRIDTPSRNKYLQCGHLGENLIQMSIGSNQLDCRILKRDLDLCQDHDLNHSQIQSDVFIICEQKALEHWKYGIRPYTRMTRSKIWLMEGKLKQN